jgi:hypothetical protein
LRQEEALQAAFEACRVQLLVFIADAAVVRVLGVDSGATRIFNNPFSSVPTPLKHA